MRALFTAACLTFASVAFSDAAWAVCPEGYKASQDNYGNEVCQIANATPAAAPKPGACSDGMYPALNDAGANVCKFPPPGTALDPVKGCPSDMTMSTDAAGKQVCKKS